MLLCWWLQHRLEIKLRIIIIRNKILAKGEKKVMKLREQRKDMTRADFGDYDWIKILAPWISLNQTRHHDDNETSYLSKGCEMKIRGY